MAAWRLTILAPAASRALGLWHDSLHRVELTQCGLPLCLGAWKFALLHTVEGLNIVPSDSPPHDSRLSKILGCKVKGAHGPVASAPVACSSERR